MLWLCLRFTQLALDVSGPEEASAVAVERQRVVCANAAAMAAGVEAGMGLAAALALSPGVRVVERQPAREAELLQALACWAEGFTPTVSLAPPAELLLEIGGCLRLFGGLAALREAVAGGLAAQGMLACEGLAPTPLAAQWLARVADGAPCLDMEGLAARLAPLPLAVLDELDGPARRTLATLGVRRVGDLLALPAAGLQRRFGAALPFALARARGERPDPRAAFVFPERFAQRLELPAKVSDAAMLQFAARRLLAALAGWLAARASGVTACTLLLEHEDQIAPSRVPLGFAEATADLRRFVRVLQERLAQTRLVAPVWRIQVLAGQAQPLAGREMGLFGQEAAQALAPVIERLRARLGAQAVHALAVVADHRPECATRAVPQATPAPTVLPPAATRPLWLLPAPRRLGERAGVPQLGSDLLRVAGPERIESGWWAEGDPGGPSAGDVRRDYFVACSARSEWLWIFRDAEGWWLHGYFA
ncbi:MAG: DNA polymerase Y family protein [Candidatus Dactylopiibacterium sp.]|nr:DNA polymerase Y family protein [Candidatus Dactylopiibacterium sp.]